VRRLFRLIDWLLELPPGLDQQFWQEIQRYEEEKRMPYMTSVERIGFEKGLQEGRIAGEEQGRAEGSKHGLLLGLETALALRFGEAGLQLLPEIRALDDPAMLEKILAQIRTVATVDELRRLWQ
jgi:predicted transposase YdaD